MKKMQPRKSESKVDRRKFMAGVAVAGAAAVTGETSKAAILPNGGALQAKSSAKPSATRPSAIVAQAELGGSAVRAPAHFPGVTHGKPGSDYMMDVIKTLEIDYIITNPASSCRGLHESLVNYGGNAMPELLTTMHEESGTAMGHGYFKVAGKPLGSLCHGTVGLQHASMAIYNAWCDRVPVILMIGNSMDAEARRPGTPTLHAAQDPAAMVRDFTKWDDQPASLQHFAESMVRAYKIAMTPPYEPVVIVLDEELQEHAAEEGTQVQIPKLSLPAPPQGDTNAVRETARMMVAAENPVIVADRAARSQAGMEKLVELAETLQIPVVDQGGRMNFPNMHPLYRRGGGAVARADFVLGLELTDFWGTVNEFVDSANPTQGPSVRPGTRLVSIGVGDLYTRANFQDFQRYQPVAIAIGADAEATLPALLEAVRTELAPAHRAAIERRRQEHEQAYAQAQARVAADAAAAAWNASPIGGARMAAELWMQIQNEDWALVSRDQSISSWPHRMWNFARYYQWIGGPGGQGVGYGLPAAVGAALAHRAEGRLAVNIQNDGDCMYAPGALWTAAHHNIPLFSIMHNNRAYHQEVMHLQRLSSWRERGYEQGNWRIATTIENPNIDYAKLADSMGVVGIGPIDNPNDLAPAIRRGIEVVKSGEPVLIDVVTQPR